MSANSASALHEDMLQSWKCTPEGITETSPNRIDPNEFLVQPCLLLNILVYRLGGYRISYFVMKNIGLGYDFHLKLLIN